MLPIIRGATGVNPEPSAHHFAPTLGKQTTSYRGAGTRRRPRPPISSLRFFCPRVTSEDREKLGAGSLLRFQGKLARASSSHARECYSPELPDVLRPSPALPRRRGSNPAAAWEPQPKRPPLPVTPRAWQTGERLHHIITRRLRFCSDARVPNSPTQSEKSEGDPFSQQPPRPQRTTCRELWFRVCRPLHPSKLLRFGPALKLQGPAPWLPSPGAGGGAATLGRVQWGGPPGTGAEFQARSPSPGRAALLRPAARAGSGSCAPLGELGSRGHQARHRWSPEENRWLWSPPG